MTTAYLMQAHYLPWLAYFEGIARADVFCVLDDVAFQPKTWQSRQRIKGPQGEQWLAVPTHGSQHTLIKDVLIDHSRKWMTKHWVAIWQNYRKATYGDYLLPFHDLYEDPPFFLRDWNVAIIRKAMEVLGITTPTVLASSMESLTPGREEHILSIVQRLGCDCLYDAKGAEAILDPKPFRDAGVQLMFQDYHHPTYRQRYGDFLPYMGVVDLIANEGPHALEIIRSGAAC